MRPRFPPFYQSMFSPVVGSAFGLQHLVPPLSAPPFLVGAVADEQQQEISAVAMEQEQVEEESNKDKDDAVTLLKQGLFGF